MFRAAEAPTTASGQVVWPRIPCKTLSHLHLTAGLESVCAKARLPSTQQSPRASGHGVWLGAAVSALGGSQLAHHSSPNLRRWSSPRAWFAVRSAWTQGNGSFRKLETDRSSPASQGIPRAAFGSLGILGAEDGRELPISLGLKFFSFVWNWFPLVFLVLLSFLTCHTPQKKFDLGSNTPNALTHQFPSPL